MSSLVDLMRQVERSPLATPAQRNRASFLRLSILNPRFPAALLSGLGPEAFTEFSADDLRPA